MRRLFQWGVYCVAAIILLSIVIPVPLAQATSGETWFTHPVTKTYETQEQTQWLPHACSGSVQHIRVNSWPGVHEACVYGSAGKTQFARYQSSNGSFAYGVAYSLDTEFTPIRDFCLQHTLCAYGQEEDALLVRGQLQYGLGMTVIKDFTKHLQKTYDNGEFYHYLGGQPTAHISLGSTPAVVNAFAVSKTGKWAVVELESYGLVRINLGDLSYRRITAPGASYGYGTNPSYELAISNDGTAVAITGWRGSIEVYEASNSCGDVLQDGSPLHFSPYTFACKRAEIDAYGMFPGFKSGYTPQFSSDGKQLSLNVDYSQGLRQVTLAPQAAGNAQAPAYSAFGDSFTSGEGETSDEFYISPTNTKENKCHVSSRSYPYIAGGFFGIATTNRACSGSRMPTVLAESQKLVTQTDVGERPSHISISVGGNDINLIGKLKTCLGVNSCEWVSAERREQGAEEIKGIFPSMVELIQTFRQDYSAAELAIIGYPRVINTSENAQCGVIVSALLNTDERRYMDEAIIYLNQILQAAARYTNVAYIDVADVYAGARLCDSQPLAMNGVRLGDDIAPLSFLTNFKIIGAESFHPTPKGHELVGGAVQRFGSNWKANTCNCLFSESLLEPSSYWKGGGDVSVEDKPIQKSGEYLSKAEIIPGSSVSVNFPAATFKPESMVTFELHSDPHTLLSAAARADGSLNTNLSFPGDIQGYHTVHALGTSVSEKPVDIYQVVSLADEFEESSDGGELGVTNPAKETNESEQKGPNTSNDSTSERPVNKQFETVMPEPISHTSLKLTSGWAEAVLGVSLPSGSVLTAPRSSDSVPQTPSSPNPSTQRLSWLFWSVVLVTGVAIAYGVYTFIRRVRPNDRYNGRI